MPLVSNPALLSLPCSFLLEILSYHRTIGSTSEKALDEFVSKAYNFMIVGGGTAGLALAARLTEDPSVNVLVLEAGENRLNVSPLFNLATLNCSRLT